nr:SdrD B-like domain-containing protein [Hyphomonas sp. Mor2]
MRLRFGSSAAALAVMFSAVNGAEADVSVQNPVPETGIEYTKDTAQIAIESGDLLILDQAPETATSIEHVDMIIEGQLTSVRSRQSETGTREYNLTDIAEALRSRTELQETLLGYHRAQDGVLMSIDMADGKVRSNRVVLGKLPDFEPREAADPWIGLNAVTVMSGTHASEDDQGRIELTLDDRLKPQFGLEVWVNGAPIDTFENEARTIGPVLLVPLEPIVDALGHQLTEAGGTVTVRRQQDQAAIRLELATGLVSVNTTPRGVTPDMQLAERDTLLLPFGAVESLTGTHIKLVPGTNRVEVSLDTRLDSSALPGANVAAEARATPFTMESLSYELSDRGPLRLEGQAHVSTYNLRGRIETAGGLQNFASEQPAWASVDVTSLNGWAGTIGDYGTGFRELSGVGGNRIRGASWRKQQPSGTIIAIAAGVPLTGSEIESDAVAVPTFGGFVAGGRLISEDQSQDIGIAASLSDGGGDGAVVVNGQKSFYFDNRETGLQSAYVAADIGAFSGEASGADIRARASASYAIDKQTGLNATASYEGAKFAAGAERANFGGVFDQRIGARTNLSVGANWRADQPWGAFNRISFASRASVRHQGGADSATDTSVSLAANSQIGETGPNLSAIVQTSQTEQAGIASNSTSFRLRGLQRYNWGSVTASYQNTSSDTAEGSQQFVATAQANPVQKRLNDKEAVIQVAPNATMNWDGDKTRIFAGVSAIFDAGRTFGSKLDLQGRFSAFSDFSAETENAATTRFLGSLEARYRLGRNAQLTAIYTDDFDGRSDLSIGVRGTVNFNPPRQNRLPDEGKGILNGRVFLDRNRDGIRQDSEPGIPGVRVTVIGTRLALNTSREGYFTIQNVKQGLYAVTVSKKSLPLGYMVPEDAQPRVTIGAGRRTNVEIPLILSGQVRGTIFIDDNANGVVDSGEKRLEGQWVNLISEETGETQTIHSASFGQYGFENVSPGTFILQTTVSGQPVRQEIQVDGKNPFVIAPIPVPPDLADKGGGVDLASGVLGEP